MMDWLKIREVYEAGEDTIRAICTVYRIHPATLYKIARAQGWKLRTNGRLKRANPQKAKQNQPDRQTLIDRLYKAFDRQMGEFEAHSNAAGDDGVTEKDARTLGSLARTLEKLIELKQETEGADDNQNKGVDIERLREELARRLERVCPKGKTE